MQPSNAMVPPPMAPPQQYPQQLPHQPPQQWMTPPPQQPPYQIPQPQQPPAAAYYYQQPQNPQAMIPTQQPHQYPAAPGSFSQQMGDEGIRSLWIGDLQYWMDEQYLYSCFAHTGEVASAKVIRNRHTGQSEGYGFIEFVSHAAAERNLQTYNGALMPNVEQTFRLNWASMGAGEKRDDATEYTIFVGDLAADVTDYMLQETFRANYTSVRGAKVVTDRVTGRTKGYGFVKFGDESEQIRAMAEMNGRFCSTRPMRIGPAANKQKIGGQSQVSYQTSQGSNAGEDDPTNTTIFVGNLDANVIEEHLRQVFGQYGELLHVKIPVGKRCGFVQFGERRSAEEAIRILNGSQLGGQSIRLSWGRSPSNKAQQQQADPSQWGSGGGAGGGGGGYYGYGGGGGYDGSYSYGGASQVQDPNMYYGGGYANYPPPPMQQMAMQQQP
ncbi:hypothetical protein M569_10604, partial [Genlisea aurea]